MTRMIVRLDPHPGVAGRVGVGADGADLEAEGGAPQDEPHQHAQADGDRRTRGGGAARVWTISGSRADAGSGLGAGHRRAEVAEDHRILRRDHPAHEEHRDAVQHDRGDHLVGAGLRLQHAGDAAPEGPAEHAGEDDHRAARAEPGTSASHENVPTHAAAVAPTRSWPSAPMLNRPARNANATASDAPMNGRGPAERRVDAIGRAEHPAQQRRVGLERVAADEQDDDGATARASRMEYSGTSSGLHAPGAVHLACHGRGGDAACVGGGVSAIRPPPPARARWP